ncbi:DUF2637 domain-containing protein [Streptomyces sp. 549]|uniref:DUF2637 domain-containing protein n=1 Tax=Streptomyces sp. 549 TaxID=3049076 RepID=UPI0024C21391|nr:DUF2637 domain-containing protein [Streptomyces sp. 549]MDK1477052.1 DUF2637 domain-containing protein [Streptomyces sp. 549]
MNRPAKTLLVLALVAVVGMAFRVSWNALRDVAKTVGADETAALLYPFVVDGLMALALVATLTLTGRDRRFALRVLAAYTLASLVLNYVHGLVPAMHHGGESVRLADWGPANWALVLLATSLPVGAIFFGSDLVAKVLHHRPDSTASNAEESTEATANQSGPDLQQSPPTPPAPIDPPAPDRGPVESAPDSTGQPDPTGPTVAVEPVAVRAAAAAVESGPRRVTGRVPAAARTATRPARTRAQLLNEAREATAGWPEEKLTANAIRLAVRTSAENARTLRDTLRAERADGASVVA